MPYHSRATAKLLTGRQSLPSACYFLTWCTHHRARTLTDPALLAAACTAIEGIDRSSDGTLLAATVMPDHIHLLLELGARLTVSQLIAKTKAAVTRQCPDVEWQLNFFDYRLRDPTDAEDFAFYIFMNPYCAGLCPLDAAWPGWIASNLLRWAFEDKLRAGGLPHPEWLAKAECFARTLPDGAD